MRPPCAAIRAHRSEPEAAQRSVLAAAQAWLAVTRGEPGRAQMFLEAAHGGRSPRTRVPWLDRWLTTVAIEADLAAREQIRRPFLVHAGSRLDDLLHRLPLLLPGEGHGAFLDESRSGSRGARRTPAGEVLSEREAEVLRFLPTMLSAAEIAADLGISVNTVKAHMRAIYRKLAVSRRSEAVNHAREAGLL